MSVYLYTIKKCAPKSVTMPDGTVATIAHKLAFACAHAGSYRADDQRNVGRAQERTIARVGGWFTGLVFVGESTPTDVRLAPPVMRWDAEPWWFDCDAFPAESVKVGVLVRAGRGWAVTDNLDLVTVKAREGEKAHGKRGSFTDDSLTPFVRLLCAPNVTPLGRAILSREPLARPAGQEGVDHVL